MSDKLGTGWVNWAEVPFDPGQGGGEDWNLDSPSTCTSNSNNSYNHQYHPNEDHHVVTYNSHLPQAADIVSETNGISSNSHYQNDSVMIPQNILSSKSTEEPSLATTLREAISISTWDPFNPFSTTDQMENDFTYQQLLTSPHSLTCQPNSEVVEVYEPPPTASYVDLMPPTTTTTTSSPDAIPDYQIMESVAPEPDSPPTISSLDPPHSAESGIRSELSEQQVNLCNSVDFSVKKGNMEKDDDSHDCYVNTTKTHSPSPPAQAIPAAMSSTTCSTSTYRQKLRKQKQSSDTMMTNNQNNTTALEIIDGLLTDEKMAILKKLFEEEPWQTEHDAKVSALFKTTPGTLRKWLFNRRVKRKADSGFAQQYLTISNFFVQKLNKWKSKPLSRKTPLSSSSSPQSLLRNTMIDTTNLSCTQHFALLMYVCNKVPDFDPSWASHISSVIGYHRTYLLYCQKNYEQLKKERKEGEIPVNIIVILDKLIDDIKRTPVLKLLRRPLPPKPLFVSKLFGRAMYHFKRVQRYRILEELFKIGMLFKNTRLYKEIGDYLGLHEKKIRSRHVMLEKVLTHNRAQLCNKGEKVVSHMAKIIKTNNFSDETVSDNDTNIKKKKREETKKETIQNTDSTISVNNVANLKDLLKIITYKERAFIIRKLFMEHPWPQRIDYNLRKLLNVTSHKFSDIMWNLRSGKVSFKLFDKMSSKCKQHYVDVKPLLIMKIEEWKNQTDLSANITTTNTSTNEQNSTSLPVPTTLSETSNNDLMHSRFIKPDPDIAKVDKNKVTRYIWHHVPFFDTSWCKLLSQRLGYNLSTVYSFRSGLAKRSAKVAAKFNPDNMNESELRIARDLITRIQQEETYKEPGFGFKGLDSSLYQFGTLDYKLTKIEARNVLMLLLQKTKPFGSFWTAPISAYLGIANIQILRFRRQSIQKNLIYEKFIINPSEKEKELATHMAKIIMSWRDEAGNPYDENIDAKLLEFRQIVSKHFDEHGKTPDDQLVFEWSTLLGIKDEICYSILQSIRSQFVKEKRKGKKL